MAKFRRADDYTIVSIEAREDRRHTWPEPRVVLVAQDRTGKRVRLVLEDGDVGMVADYLVACYGLGIEEPGDDDPLDVVQALRQLEALENERRRLQEFVEEQRVAYDARRTLAAATTTPPSEVH